MIYRLPTAPIRRASSRTTACAGPMNPGIQDNREVENLADAFGRQTRRCPHSEAVLTDPVRVQTSPLEFFALSKESCSFGPESLAPNFF